MLGTYLKDCPDLWITFVRKYNPDASTEYAVTDALKEYNATMYDHPPRVEFDTTEDKTRFILTWS